jgi:inorganic pyrophosphatase
MESFNRKVNLGGAVKDAESRHIQNSREARKNLFGQATRFEKHLATMSDEEKAKMDGAQD